MASPQTDPQGPWGPWPANGAAGTPAAATDWFDVEGAAQALDSPLLINGQPWVASQPVPVTAMADIADAGFSGGAIKAINAVWTFLSYPTIWPDISINPWGYSTECQFANLASSDTCFVGISNTGGTNGFFFGTSQSIDATHIIAFGYNGTGFTTKVLLSFADGLVHTVRGAFDGTSAKFYFDNVLKGTLVKASEPNWPLSGPARPGLYATSTAVGMAVYRTLYSSASPPNTP